MGKSTDVITFIDLGTEDTVIWCIYNWELEAGKTIVALLFLFSLQRYLNKESRIGTIFLEYFPSARASSNAVTLAPCRNLNIMTG
jgi:hypothetical protein